MIKVKEKDKINKDVLDELNKGCSMGIEAIELILKKVENNEFHDFQSFYTLIPTLRISSRSSSYGDSSQTSQSSAL